MERFTLAKTLPAWTERDRPREAVGSSKFYWRKLASETTQLHTDATFYKKGKMSQRTEM